MAENLSVIHKIIKLISVWRVYTEHCTALSLNDINLINEDLTAKLLNCAYGWSLINLNEEKANFPSIDLGDKINKIGVSVTATRTADYVHDKLGKNIKYQVYDTYPTQYFYITTQPVQFNAAFDTKGKFIFDKVDHVLNSEKLLEKIKSIDITKQKEILQILESNVGKFQFNYVEEITPNDISELLKEFSKQNPQLISSIGPEIEKIKRTEFQKKNSLNNLSEGYIKLIQQSSLPFFEQLNSFLSRLENSEVKNVYLNIVGDLQKVILIKRTEFEKFDEVFDLLEKGIINTLPELKGIRRKVQILLHFMYFQCDIGENIE